MLHAPCSMHKINQEKKKMRLLICLLSFSICLVFSTSLKYPPAANGGKSMSTLRAADIVESTCCQCAEKSMSTYDYCLSSLQVPSISHLVNLPGLAIVAMELVIENATTTIQTIKGMIEGGGAYDPFVEDCLTVCLELYQGAVQTVDEAVNAFLLDHFEAAHVYMSGVMEDAVTCEEGFKGRRGEASPLAKENKNLYELSSIVVCIIKLVSSRPPHDLPS